VWMSAGRLFPATLNARSANFSDVGGTSRSFSLANHHGLKCLMDSSQTDCSSSATRDDNGSRVKLVNRSEWVTGQYS